MIQGP